MRFVKINKLQPFTEPAELSRVLPPLQCSTWTHWGASGRIWLCCAELTGSSFHANPWNHTPTIEASCLWPVTHHTIHQITLSFSIEITAPISMFSIRLGVFFPCKPITILFSEFYSVNSPLWPEQRKNHHVQKNPNCQMSKRGFNYPPNPVIYWWPASIFIQFPACSFRVDEGIV